MEMEEERKRCNREGVMESERWREIRREVRREI